MKKIKNYVFSFVLSLLMVVSSIVPIHATTCSIYYVTMNDYTPIKTANYSYSTWDEVDLMKAIIENCPSGYELAIGPAQDTTVRVVKKNEDGLRTVVVGNEIYNRYKENGAYIKNQWKKASIGYYGSSWFYFDNNGYALKGIHEINGKLYYFSQAYNLASMWSNGIYGYDGTGMLGEVGIHPDFETALYDFPEYLSDFTNCDIFYIKKDGSIARNEWVRSYAHPSNWYYANADGHLVRDCTYEIDGKTYFFKDAIMQKGWVNLGKWYYFNSAAVNGWQKINNVWYYFDDYEMVTGYQIIDGKPYYFDEKGKLFTGWKIISGAWQYFTTTGAVNGWKSINGKWYYFYNYNMVSDCIVGMNANGISFEYQGSSMNYYCFNAKGAMVTGWVDAQGAWRYAESNGKLVQEGWKKLNNKWYYFINTAMVSNADLEIDGKTYHFNEKGAWVK